ncbi:hypothetical protein PR202_gb15381 [Eleusine coracana subsp. coracana]|uniref:Uncharacterized protein n=1 Tax=Eleusine coracana subsp. coracana TaxID=191504 RepID=A0AAV5EX04_ELECO|nr:hypothetical protein PR202_gb15381 [Eleusine coracana subsp. coracana]
MCAGRRRCVLLPRWLRAGRRGGVPRPRVRARRRRVGLRGAVGRCRPGGLGRRPLSAHCNVASAPRRERLAPRQALRRRGRARPQRGLHGAVVARGRRRLRRVRVEDPGPEEGPPGLQNPVQLLQRLR